MSQFQDIDINFKISPVTNDLMTVTDANAVIQSIHNILMCKKLWNFDNLGLGQLMFNSFQDILSGTVIMTNIEKYVKEKEPRINSIRVDNLTDIGHQSAVIDIKFTLVNKLNNLYSTSVVVSNYM